jgi:hypothetical protein
MTGINNCCVGYAAGQALTSGNGNTFIGRGDFVAAGMSVTTGSWNTIIGSYGGGAAPISATGSNYVVLSDGQANVRAFWDNNGYMTSIGVYNNAAAATNAVNVTTAGVVYRSTSSLRYKEDVKDANYGLSDVMKLRAVSYVSKNKELAGDRRYAGMIAEELDEAGLGIFVQYDDEGRPDNIHYANMVSLAFKAIQELSAQVEELKERVK